MDRVTSTSGWRKLRRRMHAFRIPALACAALAACSLLSMSAVFSGRVRLRGDVLEPVGDPRIILFLTPPHANGNPLWFFDGASEMSNPFVGRRCPHSNCVVTSDRSLASQANLLVFKGPFDSGCCHATANGGACSADRSELYFLPAHSPSNAFVFYQREAPSRTRRECLTALDAVVNYTWTYRQDSDVVRDYGGYFRLPSEGPPPKDYYSSTNESVLWYVSNCNGTPEARLRFRYVAELRKNIQVDVFGSCTKTSDGCRRGDEACTARRRVGYKFYVAFENNHCEDYVTEKFYNALRYGNVPIVRGLPKSKYEKVAPPHSFIHADDFASPAELALYLRRLSTSPREYNAYHEWRRTYGVRSNSNNDCKLCELATLRPHKMARLSEWWSSEKDCRW